MRSGQGTGPTTNFSGSIGELSGSFVDVRANSVSGDVTVLRRAGAPAEAPSVAPTDATTDAESEW